MNASMMAIVVDKYSNHSLNHLRSTLFKIQKLCNAQGNSRKYIETVFLGNRFFSKG
jgi:hypothetical protein